MVAPRGLRLRPHAHLAGRLAFDLVHADLVIGLDALGDGIGAGADAEQHEDLAGDAVWETRWIHANHDQKEAGRDHEGEDQELEAG